MPPAAASTPQGDQSATRRHEMSGIPGAGRPAGV